MSPETRAAIVEELVRKSPELAGHESDIAAQVETLDELADLLVEGLQTAREMVAAGLLTKVEPADAALAAQARVQFERWGIDMVKFAKLFGGESEEDALKIVSMSMANDPDTTVEKETAKTLILARLRPAVFDVLAA